MKNELHFYGDDRHFNPKWLLIVLAVAVIAAASIFIYKEIRDRQEEPNEEPLGGQPIEIEEDLSDSTQTKLQHWLDSCSRNDSADLVIDSMVVNDILLRIYLPLNAHPTLEVGYDVIKDTSNIIMCIGAADPGKTDSCIIGRFVRKGEVQGKGKAKKGFCAIINDTVTLGMSINTSLYEKAINDSGYFFRQRALVDSGRMVENHKSGTYFYRALCQTKSHLFVITSSKRISILDFAQALKDMGVEYAITLQSSEITKGWYCENGKITFKGDWESRKYPKTSNFICWRVNGK